MQNYTIKITGVTPLLMHADDVEWADRMDAWKSDPANKGGSKAGDDRSPAFRWIGYAYHDGEHLVIPSDNLMTCLREGGAMVPVPGGKNGKTFKSQSQSGIMMSEPFFPIEPMIAWADVSALMAEKDFATHKAAANRLGFSLFVKRAKVGANKHVRVRPRFDTWGLTVRLTVADEQITKSVLSDMFAYAGKYKGLGDWRPGSKTPGTFGMFTAQVQ
jgi:hypothetical protein